MATRLLVLLFRSMLVMDAVSFLWVRYGGLDLRGSLTSPFLPRRSCSAVLHHSLADSRAQLLARTDMTGSVVRTIDACLVAFHAAAAVAAAAAALRAPSTEEQTYRCGRYGCAARL